ncbi:hypothetical protein V6N12_050883 [Hibiscus sabdariffa]|uniref:Uncharacterized protein n=1 Tax=Hibiscus sabdariffa TaxID=183260 RepID=A0ABR2GDV5_9ROSI
MGKRFVSGLHCKDGTVVGIEDEGKLQQESSRWVCDKERSNKKSKAAASIPMRILLKLYFIFNANGSFLDPLCSASR